MSDFSFSVKFILEKRRNRPDGKLPIYVRIIKGRMKAEMHIHEYIHEDKWDEAMGRVKLKCQEAVKINHKISAIEKTINDIRWELEREEKPFDSKDIVFVLKGGNKKIEPRLFEVFDLHIKEVIEKNLHTKSVINHYKQARRKLFDYLKSISKQNIHLKEFSRSHIDGFEHYLLTTKVPVIDKPLNRNTTNRYLVKVKAVFNKAIVKELITKSPFVGFVIHEASSSRVYLTENELQKIIDHPLSRNPSLIRVRDIFLFSVYTGLRFGDALNLKENNIYLDSEKEIWITCRQDKTGQPIQIPMLSPAQDIYNKYLEDRIRTGYVLPRLSNQKVNSYIKEIARLAGIEKTITHHVARHTFATTILLDNGIPLELVSQFLGHLDLKSTQIYAKITKKNLASIAKKINLAIEPSKAEIKESFGEISKRLSKEAQIFNN